MLTLQQEKNTLFILILLQVANMIDVVIIMPLGPMILRTLQITNFEFGIVISAYTVAAGLSGLVGAFWIDKFQRRTFLLVLLTGFLCGNFMCSISEDFVWLLFSRFITGIFGGLIFGVVWTIIGDVIPANRRGSAIGKLSTSFSIASVVGVPIAIALANMWFWEAAYYMLSILSLIILIIASVYFPTIIPPQFQSKEWTPWKILSNGNTVKSILFISFVMGSGFFVIPYLSPFLVHNVKITETDLVYVYFFGGIATYFSAQIAGKAVDLFGNFPVFLVGISASIIIILMVTSMSLLPFWIVLMMTTFFMVALNARFIAAMSIATASVELRARPAFMNFSSASQHIVMGMITFFGGIFIQENADGSLVNYFQIGMMSVALCALCIGMAFQIKQYDH